MANTPLFIPELGDKFVDYRDPIWGDSYNWSWNRPITQVQYLVIHHTVTAHDATPDDIALLHKARGWGGIGYHFLITKDGRVWYVGDIGTARANVLNMNEKVIGISMIGDFTKHLPSDEQITSAHKLCKFFIEVASVPNINGWEDVVGHKELQATACPGTSWDKTQPGDMWWRIKTNTVYNPPPVQHEEVYRVTFKGQVLAEYETNPVDKIAKLTKAAEDAKTELSSKIQENATLSSELAEQERDNAALVTSNREAYRQRDEALASAKSCEANLSQKDTMIDQLEDVISNQDKQIKALKSEDPLSGYDGWELIGLGIGKVLSRNKKKEDANEPQS